MTKTNLPEVSCIEATIDMGIKIQVEEHATIPEFLNLLSVVHDFVDAIKGCQLSDVQKMLDSWRDCIGAPTLEEAIDAGLPLPKKIPPMPPIKPPKRG